MGAWGCEATWVPTDTGRSTGSTDPPYNLCENLLDEIGYPTIIQADLEHPNSFTILFTEEPSVRPCGGMVVEAEGGEAWVMGMIQTGTWLDLQVPALPPEQFKVVSWGLEDNPEDLNDSPDENRLYWAGTNTTATSAQFVKDGDSYTWERRDLANAEGGFTAYLVRVE